MGRLEGKKPLGNTGIDGKIILRWIFKRWDGEGWTGLNWLKVETGGGRF